MPIVRNCLLPAQLQRHSCCTYPAGASDSKEAALVLCFFLSSFLCFFFSSLLL